MSMSPAIHRVLDALFPRVCHLCGNRLGPGTKFVCEPCRLRLPRTGFHRMADNAMERRFLGRVPFQRAAGHFFYSRDSDMARLIHDFKYHGFPDLARELGRLVGRELMSTSFLDDAEIIVPVPMHWRKLIIRGYNQSLEIARGLSDATTLPVVEAIKAVRHHRTQTSMSLSGRLNNISGMFRLNERVNVSGRGVLLVDDVCTTGATLSEAGELLAAGAPGCRLTLLTMAVTF